jgi:hypothetical protein
MRLNLIGESRKVKDVTAGLAMWKLWKADERARRVYAEYQWTVFESDPEEAHLLCMFQDRTVRRRFDKMLRDGFARSHRHMYCFECGEPLMRLLKGKYVPTASRRPRVCAECKEAVKRQIEQARNAALDRGHRDSRIGARSLKALKSDASRRKLRTSTVMTPTKYLNVNGPAWPGHRVPKRRKK